MINKLKKILQKNQTLYLFLKKAKMIFLLLKVYFLKIFDFLRKDTCTKNSIRCEYDVKNKNYKYTVLGRDTPSCCLTHLYEITRDVTQILNETNIDYFIMYGTLLGQVRHNQTFIPWDTDVDIVVMQKDRDKVTKLLYKNISNTYNLINDKKILKINFSKSNHLHADIYFWEEKDGILIDTLNDYWIKNRVKSKDVFPLTSSKLYDLDIKVPRNSEKVLKFTYGDDCLDNAFRKYAFEQKNLENFEEGIISKIYEDKNHE
jgi:hypothetical protein